MPKRTSNFLQVLGLKNKQKNMGDCIEPGLKYQKQ